MAEKCVYQVENLVGNAKTRFHRALSSTTHRGKLFIAGQRLLPEGKISLTEAQFRVEAVRLKQMVLEGKIAIYTPENVKITSTHTGEFVLFRTTDGASKLLPKGDAPDCFYAYLPPKALTEVPTADASIADVPTAEVPAVAEPEVLTSAVEVTEGPAEVPLGMPPADEPFPMHESEHRKGKKRR